jgi:hypothetical protein
MQEGEPTSLPDQVENYLGEQLPLTTWRAERENAEFQEIDNKVQELKGLLRQRASRAGREEGATLENRGIKDRYYDAALRLAEVLSGVLHEAPEIEGKATPSDDQAISYEVDSLQARERWEFMADTESAIERGETANSAQNHFGESLVKVFEDLGWPGEELQTILKDKKLIW